MGRALDLRLTGRGFKSYSGQKLHNVVGQVVHTYVPLSPSSITWYWPNAVKLCGWEGNLPGRRLWQFATEWMTYSHLRADCLYTGISSGPSAG